MHYADYYSKMTMQQIIIFLEAAKFESITKAAESLHITHSAISKSIMKLEYALELNLFIREKQRLRLTPAGKVLRDELMNVMLEIEKAIISAELAQEVGTRPLIIGMPAGVDPEGYVFNSLENYKARNPRFDFFIEAYYFADLPQALIDEKVDIVFSFFCDARSYSALNMEMLFSCPWIAHLHKDNPICEQETVLLEDLRTQDFLFPYSIYGNTYADTLLEMCRESGFIPKASYYMYSNSVATLNVQHKNDVLLTDPFFSWRNPYVVQREIADRETGIIIATRKNEKSSIINGFMKETILFWHTGK